MRTTTTDRKPSRLAVQGGIEVGFVLRPHGQTGALILKLLGEAADSLLHASEVLLRGAPGAIPYRVLRGSAVPAAGEGLRVRLELAGIDSRERAERWVGAAAVVEEGALQPLDAGEFYWRELIGLRCFATDGRELGRVSEILATPGHDVLVVVAEGRREPLLIPAVDEVLREVEPAQGRLVVELPQQAPA